MFTWIRRTRSAQLVVFLSMGLSICSLETSGTASILAHGHDLRSCEIGGRGAQLLWRADFRSIGLRDANAWNGINGFVSLGPLPGPLGFLSDGRLVVVFSTPEGSGRFSPRRLRALFLDSVSGRVVRTSDWSGLFQQTGLLPLRDGLFLVRATRRLILYSARAERLTEFELPRSKKPGYSEWGLEATPSGQFVVLMHQDQVKCSTELEWLSSDGLTVEHTWKDPKGEFVVGQNDLSVSDSHLVATLRFPARGCGEEPDFSARGMLKALNERQWCEVAVRPLRGPWRTILRASGFCSHAARFVDDEEVFFFDSGRHRMFLLRPNGAVTLSAVLGDQEYPIEEHVALSFTGGRFAVPIAVSKGVSNELLGLHPRTVVKRIMVYDLRARQWVCTLDAEELGISQLSGLALSPDGSVLAVLGNGVVKAFHLPSADSIHSPHSATGRQREN